MASQCEIVWAEGGEFTAPGNPRFGLGEGWYWRAYGANPVGPFATMTDALADSLQERTTDRF